MPGDPRTYSRDVPVQTTCTLDDLSEGRRRAIFAALAEATSGRVGLAAARFAVAKKYTVTVLKVEAIEAEGLARGWPTA